MKFNGGIHMNKLKYISKKLSIILSLLLTLSFVVNNMLPGLQTVKTVQAKEAPTLTTVYEDSNCKIQFYKVEKDGERANVTFRVTNYTSRTLTFQAECISLNGESTDNIIMSDDIAPNSNGSIVAKCTIDIENFDLSNIVTIGGELRIIDFNDDKFSSYSAIFSNIRVSSNKETILNKNEGIQLFDDENITISFLSVEEDEYSEDSILVNFRVKNKTSKVLTLQGNVISLNGESTKSIIMSDAIAPYSTGNIDAKCKIDKTFLDINNITLIGGELRIIDFNSSNWKSYSAFINGSIVMPIGTPTPIVTPTPTVAPTITVAPTPTVAPITTPKVTSSKATLYVGYKNHKITYKNLKSDAKITYKSNNSKVATVTNKGIIKPISKGKATISIIIKQNKKEYTSKITVTVKNPYITVSNKTNTLSLGDIHTFKCKAYGLDKVNIQWSSSDNTIATIGKTTGKLTTKTEGTVKITAKDIVSGKATSFDITIEEIKTGSVEGNITWQYNKYVGTKADTGAYVALIPIEGNTKEKDNNSFAMLRDTNGENGIYSAKVDGMGEYFIDDVPVGKYLVLIVSRNTTEGDRFDDEEAWLQWTSDIFSPLISDTDLKTLQLMIGYKSWHFYTIEIKEGKIKRISHDFGYTYI